MEVSTVNFNTTSSAKPKGASMSTIPRQNIETLIETILLYDRQEWDLDDFIKALVQHDKKATNTAKIRFIIHKAWESCDDYPYLEIYSVREETDEEYQGRVTRVEEQIKRQEECRIKRVRETAAELGYFLVPKEQHVV